MLIQKWVEDREWDLHDPKLEQLRSSLLQLPHTRKLSEEIALDPPGILVVRGPRQTGKSTFLRQLALKCLSQGVPAEALAILDAERCASWQDLLSEVESFLKQHPQRAVLLIDEITSVKSWWKAIKIAADDGLANGALLVCTGSNAMDLSEGADLMPGRRGKRHPVDFELLPVRFRDVAGTMKLHEYLLTGGMPWAIGEFLRHGFVPSFVYALYAAWIEGSLVRQGHTKANLDSVLNYIAARIGSHTSVVSLARDCGIGSNSTAERILSVLEGNYTLLVSHWSEPGSTVFAPRKNRKFFPADIFLYHVFKDFGKGWDWTWQMSKKALDEADTMGRLIEALVAAELRHTSTMIPLRHYLGKKEIDFTGKEFIEVKYQRTVSIAEFGWVKKVIPKGAAFTVITQQTRSREDNIRLVPLEDWLMEER